MAGAPDGLDRVARLVEEGAQGERAHDARGEDADEVQRARQEVMHTAARAERHRAAGDDDDDGERREAPTRSPRERVVDGRGVPLACTTRLPSTGIVEGRRLPFATMPSGLAMLEGLVLLPAGRAARAGRSPPPDDQSVIFTAEVRDCARDPPPRDRDDRTSVAFGEPPHGEAVGP